MLLLVVYLGLSGAVLGVATAFLTAVSITFWDCQFDDGRWLLVLRGSLALGLITMTLGIIFDKNFRAELKP